MNKVICVAVLFLAVGLLGAKSLITQDEALVAGALTSLKFESVPGKPGLVGAPPKLKITKQTIDYLEKLRKDERIIEVQNNGAIQIMDAKK
jgi:hypothetical protein